MRLPLQRWFQFILVISLVLNPVLGSSVMVHTDTETDSVSDHANDSSATEHDCDHPTSTVIDCCCPMAFSGCGGSAIHATVPNPLLDGTRDWRPPANAYWQNRLIDVEPRPPRSFS